MPIIARPQKTTTSFFGAVSPCEESVPMTTDAESAEVMKKTARTKMSTNGVSCASGRVSKSAKSTCSGVAEPSKPATPSRESVIAAPPKTVKASARIRLGTARVTTANSRSVRPREMRAMNMPTNGVQAIHQAQ